MLPCHAVAWTSADSLDDTSKGTLPCCCALDKSPACNMTLALVAFLETYTTEVQG